jgi:hypothetical protein
MAVSRGLKQAVKNQTQRSRRLEVLLFCSWIVLGFLDAGRPLTWGHLIFTISPYFYVIVMFRQWKNRVQRVLPVNSLDDRAVLKYGVEFEKLAEAQQKEILERFRVGTYLLNYFPDEFDKAREAQAHLRAYDVMKLLLPSIILVYWTGWRLLPNGQFRAGWTNGPVVLSWVLLLVLALPQMIQMWTQPDDVDELRVVNRERQA